ncbi:hypothetical protein ACHAWF_012268 [Thalassiosira exigua]
MRQHSASSLARTEPLTSTREPPASPTPHALTRIPRQRLKMTETSPPEHRQGDMHSNYTGYNVLLALSQATPPPPPRNITANFLGRRWRPSFKGKTRSPPRRSGRRKRGSRKEQVSQFRRRTSIKEEARAQAVAERRSARSSRAFEEKARWLEDEPRRLKEEQAAQAAVERRLREKRRRTTDVDAERTRTFVRWQRPQELRQNAAEDEEWPRAMARNATQAAEEQRRSHEMRAQASMQKRVTER